MIVLKRTLFKNATVITEGKQIPDRSVICEGGIISGLYGNDMRIESAAEIVDLKGAYLTPGFIDMHIHGLLGNRTDLNSEELDRVSSDLPRFGVTGFQPAVAPCEDDLTKLKDLAKAGFPGAKNLGFFLEGHYLALTGALPYIQRDYSVEKVNSLIDSASPYRIVFGISPEISNAEELIPAMATQGTPVFITHTGASVEQTQTAIDLGARHATHFYDVFPYPGEIEHGVRGCGSVEIILADSRTTADFILDGEHVQPAAVKLALRCMGELGVSLITDANVSAGLPPGRYTGLSGVEIVVHYQGGPARMTEGGPMPGGLVGSGLTMDAAVRNAVTLLGVSLAQAVRMATENPARTLGMDNRIGKIAPGMDADLVVLDRNLQVISTYISGKRIYHT